MRRVADDQINATPFQKTTGGANNIVLTSGNSQAIHNRPHFEVSEMPVVMHGSGEHHNPTADFRIRAHGQPLETSVVGRITNTENVAASVRQQGV
jgi:hypothetical protein